MRATQRAAVDKEDVRHMTDAELTRLGVSLFNRTDLVLECNECGETWSPQLDAEGKLAFDFWVCPVKCNAI